MIGDVRPASRAASRLTAALVRWFGSKRGNVLEGLASRSDAAVQVLFATAAAGLLLIDKAGRIMRANPALRAMLAADVDLEPGAAAMLIFAEEERAAAWTAVRAMLAGHRQDCRLNARLRLAVTGGDRWVDIACRPIHEKNGTISGLLAHITDITAQLRLESELAKSRELEAVGNLVGGVAHDFNNLLTAILGAVELVQEHDHDAAHAIELEQIRRSAERGAALVRNLLALGRQQYLQAMPLDVNAELREFAQLVGPALGKDVQLELELEEPGRRIRVDPGQLDQVLRNLAMNARHAMPTGGRLTLCSGHVTLYRKQMEGQEAIPPGRYVTIAVRDTGTGIPPELLEQIFEPFFTTRRAQGGSGLGLATAHGIIRQSGGYMTVQSELGKGTSFEIYLPREEASPRTAAAAIPSETLPPSVPLPVPPTDTASASARHLLLVDDEQAVRRITARALAKRGWGVLEAESAEAALALLDADPTIGLTAMVSDVVMPGQDGAALVDAVRARYPGLPAILVSGYAEGLLTERAAAAISFLEKPYAPKTLLALLENVAPISSPSLARSDLAQGDPA